VRASCQGVRHVVEAIRDVAPVPILLLVAPPPVRDLVGLIAANPWMRKQVPELMRQADELGVSPVGFRVKVWRVYARAMVEISAELGIECQIPPQTATRQRKLGVVDGTTTFESSRSVAGGRVMAAHPYAGMPDYAFWRRAVGPVAPWATWTRWCGHGSPSGPTTVWPRREVASPGTWRSPASTISLQRH
jgi:hypothetical protein